MTFFRAVYLVAGTAFAFYMLAERDEQYDCVAQMAKYEMVEQLTPAHGENVHVIAVEYAAAREACKANLDVLSIPDPAVAADAARSATKAEAIQLLKNRFSKPWSIL